MNFFPARKGENPLSLAQMEKSCYLCASFQKIAKDGTTKPGAKIHNFYHWCPIKVFEKVEKK